jgi:putative membrane protein
MNRNRFNNGGMNMNTFWENPYVLTVAYYLVAILSIVISLAIFEVVTKYKNWEQIKQGNLSVAMATGGKIFGVANIFRFSIGHNDTIWQTFVWGGIGFVLLLVAYFIFEFMTPSFNVDEEIEKDNRAVGLISLLISVGLSYIIGASIT